MKLVAGWARASKSAMRCLEVSFDYSATMMVEIGSPPL